MLKISSLNDTNIVQEKLQFNLYRRRSCQNEAEHNVRLPLEISGPGFEFRSFLSRKPVP